MEPLRLLQLSLIHTFVVVVVANLMTKQGLKPNLPKSLVVQLALVKKLERNIIRAGLVLEMTVH